MLATLERLCGLGYTVEGLENLRRIHPRRVGVYIGFNEPLSHLIVTGGLPLDSPSGASLPGPLPLQFGVSMPASHASGGPDGPAGLNWAFT